MIETGPPPDLLLRRRPSGHSPRFSETQYYIGIFESGEQRYKADVVVMKFGFVMLYRLLSLGEEEGRRGLLSSEQNVQECDATKMLRELKLAT